MWRELLLGKGNLLFLAAEIFLVKSADATSSLEDALRSCRHRSSPPPCVDDSRAEVLNYSRFPPMEGVRTRYSLIRPGSAVYGRNVGIAVFVSSIPALGFSLLFLLIFPRCRFQSRVLLCSRGARALIINLVSLPRIRRKLWYQPAA